MSKRNPFPFTKAHPGGSVKWLSCTIAQRGLLQLLWSLGEPAKDGSTSMVETAGSDTASHLTMRLNVRCDRDRKKTTRAVRELMASGWIEVVGEGVLVHADRPVSAALREHSESTQRSVREHTESTQRALTEHSDTPKAAESLNTALPDRLDRSDKIRSIEPKPLVQCFDQALVQSTEQPAPLFRAPLPEPPPDLAPSDMAKRLQLAERIERYMATAGRKAVGFAPSVHRKQSLALAEWALNPTNQADWKLGATDLARSVCDGLLADDYARERGCPLVLAVRNPPGYLKALKPVPKLPPPPTRLEHQVFKQDTSWEDKSLPAEENVAQAGNVIATLMRKIRRPDDFGAAGAAE